MPSLFELETQRMITAAFIAADPYVVVLVPQVRTTTPDGTPAYVDGPPRPAQAVKRSELAYDQRPTVTINGQERTIDYHLIGLHDMQVAVGDYWIDSGSRYEVVAFSDGFGYETKVLVSRHISRNARA